MPTLYQDRCDISLYDAQYLEGMKRPIPPEIVENVVSALLRFKTICEDFGVPDHRVRIVATEATRTAMNSQQYRDRIESVTGWTVDLLPKEEEGRIGAMGIASSFAGIKGLALDLGGGSIQMTWIVSQDGEVQMSSRGSISFPWGAAALMRLIGEAITQSEQEQLQREVTMNFQQAMADLELPRSILEDAAEHGFTLYLSGGGFRGWGHRLMSMHAITPYPIPIINGFRVPGAAFSPESADLPINDDDNIFRVSARRASQVPAVKLIVLALMRSVPNISNIYFAQGGVREGLIFSTLPPSIRAQQPLHVATLPFAPNSTSILIDLLQSLIPSPLSTSPKDASSLLFSSIFLTSIIHLSFSHAPLPKDIRSSAALRSTTSGLLAGTHGISHDERALLALVLCERWGGEISSSDAAFHAGLVQIAGAEAAWWSKYIGRVVQGLGKLFPAGLVRQPQRARGGPGIEESATTTIVQLAAEWGTASPKRKKEKNSDRDRNDKDNGTQRAIILTITEKTSGISAEVDAWRDALEKVGKKKNWVEIDKGAGGGSSSGGSGSGGKESGGNEQQEEKFGIRVEVRVRRWN